MKNTDNFDLSLYDGSDKFNPLIVENGNMEKIDEQMAKNFVGTVGTATELKSGTVHALTRVDDTPVFRFVATSNYSAGDTFTVDGLQVSGLLADGRTLSDGAYVINSNVLCCLTGTVLTFYVTAGSVELADDSEKLGGQLPSYYGTASDVAQASQVAQASSVIANNASERVTELSSAIDGINTYADFDNVIASYNSWSAIHNAVIPSDGYLVGFFYTTSNNASIEIRLNDIVVAKGNTGNISVSIPVKAGTRVTCPTDYSVAQFTTSFRLLGMTK